MMIMYRRVLDGSSVLTRSMRLTTHTAEAVSSDKAANTDKGSLFWYKVM